MTDDVSKEDRRHNTGGDQDQRTEFQRDRDRVLYSSAFRRLAGVSQVVHVGEGHRYHNRLTHSLKVAQVGRRMSEHLIEKHNKSRITEVGGLEPAIVETAALAHDLGHPPFGHAAEKELQSKSEEYGLVGRFEGNPQSFRILNKVATRRTSHPGLDLTRGTLNAVLKYPWKRETQGPRKKQKKWGYYHVADYQPDEAGEKQEYDFARKLGPSEDEPCVEASLMDWADDVTYAIHDVTDFYRAGLIPLDEILRETAEQEDFIKSFENEKGDEITNSWEPAEFIRENFGNLIDAAGNASRREEQKTGMESEVDRNPFLSPYTNSSVEQASIEVLKSELIDRYFGLQSQLEVKLNPDKKGNLEIDPDLQNEVILLKYLTEHYVVNNPALVAQQKGHRLIIGELFDCFYNASQPDAEYLGLIGPPFDEEIKDVNELEDDDIIESSTADQWRARIVTDLITSLTEQQALNLYERVTGHTPGSVTDRITD